jgi:hypothetical protein
MSFYDVKPPVVPFWSSGRFFAFPYSTAFPEPVHTPVARHIPARSAK